MNSTSPIAKTTAAPGKEPPTVNEVCAMLRRELTPIYGRGESDAMIRLIFEHLKGWSTVDMFINEGKPVSDYILGKIQEILERLQRHEPIQYILGLAYFYGMNFKVGPGVLIPRPETEELVDIIVNANKEPDLEVLDIATGSGCIAIALARNLRFPHVEALDNSLQALEYARENAKELKAGIDFFQDDVFEWNPDPQAYDIIVSNPPYIDLAEKEQMEANVVDHEPHEALFVPDDNPLVYFRRIADIAAEGLKPGGRLYLEINPRHARQLGELLEKSGFTDINISLDVHARRRFVSARRAEPEQI